MHKNMSLISYCLFSGWLLSFLFEGQIFYSLLEDAGVNGIFIIELAKLMVFIGLVTSGFLIKTKSSGQITMIISAVICILGSLIFYLPFSTLWYISVIPSAYFSGLFVSCWGFHLKMYFTSEERFKTAADMLIYSNILMIIINVLTVHTSAQIGLAAAIVSLLGALLMLYRLKANYDAKDLSESNSEDFPKSISSASKPFIYLYIFIFIITIDSGLMYQVVNPAFAHFGLITTYYWAIPYILTLLILRNLSAGIRKAYILYISIVMIGLSYISFMWLDRSVASYLIINSIMLGAFGVCDLFWWSILGSYLDYSDNTAQVFGIGLSINILGILVGGFIGNGMAYAEINHLSVSVIALVIVFTALMILPLLNSQLSRQLKDNEFLVNLTGMTDKERDETMVDFNIGKRFTEKEVEVVNLLMRGYTYKMIAKNLYISENTIKFHIKNIYLKMNVNNKMELIKKLTDNNLHS